MPVIATVATTAIGAGVAINSANQQKKAADASLAAQTAANDKSLAAQQAQFDRVQQLQQPFQQGGVLGMQALLQRLGLTNASGTPTGQAPPDPYFGYNIPHAGGAPPTAPAPPAPIQPIGMSMAGGLHPLPVGQTPTGALPTGGAHPLPEGQSFPPPNKTGSPMPMPGAPDTGSGVQVPGSPAAAQVPDWNAFLQANPDIAQWAAQGHGDPSKPAGSQSPQEAAAYWYQNAAAQGDPRAQQPLPMMADPNAPPSNTDQTPGAPQAPDLMNAPRPDAPPVPTFTRPDQGTTPTFGPAPSQDSYFNANLFHEDPGYQFALQQGQRNLNANFGAKGLLKSGGAIQGAIDYGQGMADQQYGNWFNRQNSLYGQAVGQYNTDRAYGTNVFNTNRTNANQNFENDRTFGTNLSLNQRDFANNNFTNDRSYQAGRYDTGTGNLFSLAQIGQNAAGAVGGAGASYANNSSNIYGAQANAASNAANQRAQANSGMVGAIGGVASNLFNAFPGFTSAAASPMTVGNAYPTVTGAQAPIMPSGALTSFKPPVF